MTDFRRLGTKRQKFGGLHALGLLSCAPTPPCGLVRPVGRRNDRRVGRDLRARRQRGADRADTPTPLISDQPAATEQPQKRHWVRWLPDQRSVASTAVTLTPGSTGRRATARQTSVKVRNAVTPYHLTSGDATLAEICSDESTARASGSTPGVMASAPKPLVSRT